MNKSGQITRGWLWITYLVLVGIIIGVFIGYVSGQDDNVIMQEFYLNDITFLVNKILSSEFVIEYEYDIPEEFFVEITEDEVIVILDKRKISKNRLQGDIFSKIEDNKIILRRA